MFTQLLRLRLDISWVDKIRPFGVDLFCTSKKFLILNLVTRNLKLKYRKSSLGIVWTMLMPLLISATYIVIFKYIVRLQIENYPAYVIAGTLPWTLFSQSLFDGSESVLGNYSIMSKVPIPFHVFPFTAGAVNTINLIIALPVILAISLYYGMPVLNWSLLQLPVLLVLFFLLGYFLTLFFSVGLVYFRDLRHILQIGLQIWMYGTPILYTTDMIPEKYRWVLDANPFAGWIINFRRVVLDGLPMDSHYLSVTCIWVLVLGIGGVFVIKHAQPRIIEAV